MPVIFNFLFRYVVLGRFCNFLSGLVVAGVSWSRYPSYQKKKVLISQFCFISFFNWFTKSQTLDVCGLKWTREKALAKFWLPNFSSKLTEFGIAIMARRTTAHFTGKLGQSHRLEGITIFPNFVYYSDMSNFAVFDCHTSIKYLFLSHKTLISISFVMERVSDMRPPFKCVGHRHATCPSVGASW